MHGLSSAADELVGLRLYSSKPVQAGRRSQVNQILLTAMVIMLIALTPLALVFTVCLPR